MQQSPYVSSTFLCQLREGAVDALQKQVDSVASKFEDKKTIIYSEYVRGVERGLAGSSFVFCACCSPLLS